MMRRDQSGRHGLSRVEVMVLGLFALIGLGLLATLLLRAREASDRAQCADHLRRLGTAVRKFHGSAQALPPARIADRYATWAVLLAPYLVADRNNPLKDWDETLPYYVQPAAVREGQLGLFYCPARRRPGQVSTEGDVPGNGNPEPRQYPGALGDYACVAGDGDPRFPWDGPNANGPFVIAEVLKRDGDRVLEWRSRVGLKDLKHGDVTLLLGDKHVPVVGRTTVAVGDGALYNGEYPGSWSRVGGPGFGLAASDEEKYNRNFGGNHVGGIAQFIQVDTSLKVFTPEVSETLLGKLMVREKD